MVTFTQVFVCVMHVDKVCVHVYVLECVCVVSCEQWTDRSCLMGATVRLGDEFFRSFDTHYLHNTKLQKISGYVCNASVLMYSKFSLLTLKE